MIRVHLDEFNQIELKGLVEQRLTNCKWRKA
jgi:hypothetical protein